MGSEFKIFLYILIGIAYLFSKLYRKELKKQNERQAGKRPVSGRTAEDIFRELQKTLNIPELETTPSDRPLAQSVKERKTDDEQMRQAKRMFSTEGQSKLKHYKPIRPSKLKHSGNGIAESSKEAVIANDYGPEIDFDARKAVIFAEILKRPEY